MHSQSFNPKKYAFTVFMSINLLAGSFLSTEAKASFFKEMKTKAAEWRQTNQPFDQLKAAATFGLTIPTIKIVQDIKTKKDKQILSNDLFTPEALESDDKKTRHLARTHNAKLEIFKTLLEQPNLEQVIESRIIQQDFSSLGGKKLEKVAFKKAAEDLNINYDSEKLKDKSKQVRREEKNKEAVIKLYIKEVQNSIKQNTGLQLYVPREIIADALKGLKSPAQREQKKAEKNLQSSGFMSLIPIHTELVSGDLRVNMEGEIKFLKPLLKRAEEIKGKELSTLLKKTKRDSKKLTIGEQVQLLETIEQNGWYYNPEDIMNIPINPDPNYQVPVNINPTIGYKSIFSADNTYTLRYFDCKNNKVQELDLTSKLLEFGKTFELQGIKEFVNLQI